MALDSIPGLSGLLPGAFGQAYNEAAFRYFLAVDRLRAERSQRVVILVLASVRRAPGRSATLDSQYRRRHFHWIGRQCSRSGFRRLVL